MGHSWCLSPKSWSIRDLHRDSTLTGAIYDVIIDLRPMSPTITQHVSVVLTTENRRMLYIPERFAQGFQTRKNESEIFYQLPAFYDPQCAKEVRWWNDSAFGIQWLVDERLISDRDQSYPDLILTRRKPNRLSGHRMGVAQYD